MTDHADEAAQLLHEEDLVHLDAADFVQVAQAHALLAIAEQLRVANLIAWESLHLVGIDEGGFRIRTKLPDSFIAEEIDHTLDIDAIGDRHETRQQGRTA